VYRPAAVQGSGYRSQWASADQEEALLPFVNAPAREKPNAFRQRLRQLAVKGNRWETIADPSGRLVALYVVHESAAQVEVPVLRVFEHRHADTIARQLLFSLRNRTVQARRPVLRVTDPHPSRAVEYAAVADGFRRDATTTSPWCSRSAAALRTSGGQRHRRHAARIFRILSRYDQVCPLLPPPRLNGHGGRRKSWTPRSRPTSCRSGSAGRPSWWGYRKP
jgi:hypothetical protein